MFAGVPEIDLSQHVRIRWSSVQMPDAGSHLALYQIFDGSLQFLSRGRTFKGMRFERKS